ncbi:MAG: methyltransferase domain-containing protein, partial [Caldilineae bacterium]
ITELCADEDGWRLCYLNRREHLPRPVMQGKPKPPHTPEEMDAAQEAERIRHVYNRAAVVYSHDPDKQEAVPRLSGDDLWRFAQLEPGARVLEVGAGCGRMAVELAQAGAGEVIGVDVSPAMLEQAELRRLSLKEPALAQRISFRLGFGRDLPFVDHRFDVVILCQIFHHIAQPLPTLEECRRVLQPGGQLVVVDLAGPEDAVKRATYNAIEAKRNPSHAAVRTVQQMQSLLEQARFTVEKHEVRTATCSAHLWLSQLGVDDGVRTQVLEMLEASMETDAAGLHVRRQDNDLVFDEPIALIAARRTTSSSDTVPAQ